MPRCARCFQPAVSRCGRCRQVWYCTGDCQRKDWSLGHRAVCIIGSTVAGDGAGGNGREATRPDPPEFRRPEVFLEPWDTVLTSLEAPFRQDKPRGMINARNTCFALSVMQALAACPPVRDYLAPTRRGEVRPHQCGKPVCYHCTISAHMHAPPVPGVCENNEKKKVSPIFVCGGSKKKKKKKKKKSL
jgi:hypothetical protein